MVSTLQVYEELRQTLDEPAAKSVARQIAAVYLDLQQTATRADVAELRATVQELAEAQKRTEQRVNELAEAQKRTEQRVNELAEAQKRTEQRVNELAEAQKRTEETLRRVVVRLDDTNAQLGGLAMTVGYTLENQAYRSLPALLKRDYRISLVGRLTRDFLTDRKGRDVEVNILGTGNRDDRRVMIIGESKAQLSRREVDRFVARRVAAIDPGEVELFPLIVTHMIAERGTVEYAKEKGVAVYFSYDFDT